MSETVVLIDAGTGNLRSVHKALEAVGAQVLRTADPQAVRRGDRLVLPGVGAFGDFMAGLRQRGLVEAVLEAVDGGAPLLGICVGMQALFEVGEEMGEHAGLGLLPGRVVAFPAHLREQGLKIPHTGWNFVRWERDNPLQSGLEGGGYAYFNHSFYCRPARAEDVIARTTYGLTFASAVQRANLLGVQFHPEKSQRVGLRVLENFLRWNP